jgi:hypothetical protein
MHPRGTQFTRRNFSVMNKLAMYALAFVFALTSLGISTAQAAGSATFGLSLSHTDVVTGDSFSVIVYVNPNGESLDTVRLEMTFDASLMEVSSYTLGTAFPYQSPSNMISNATGMLSEGAFTWEGAVTESAIYATIVFRALRAGDTIITVEDDSKLISDGEEKIDVDGMSSIGSVSVSITGEDVASESGEDVTEGETMIDSSWSAEQIALVYFGAFYARMPESGDDWEALHCIAYGGCMADPRSLQAEADALTLFGQKYAKMPGSFYEWNVLHTIAYTDLLTCNKQTDSSESELSLEEQAIGWFGKITGYLPSSSEEWTAVHYMVDGYIPDVRDLSAESSAITTFVKAFGYLPSTSQHWNIVSAIAYSGAF